MTTATVTTTGTHVVRPTEADERDGREWNAAVEFPKVAKKLLGLDVKPIVARHAEKAAPAAAAGTSAGETKKPARSKARR